MNSVFLVALYESKMLARTVTFFLLAGVGLIGIAGFHFFYHTPCVQSGVIAQTLLENRISTPSIYPHSNALLFCVFQAFVCLFWAGDFLYRERLKMTNEVFGVRPVDNWDYVVGKALAIVWILIVLYVINVMVALFIQFFFSTSICVPFYYVFYFVTLVLPAIVFMAFGVVWIKLLFKSMVFPLLLVGLYLVAAITFLPNVLFGFLDYTASGIPNLFSELTGHPAWGRYLSQRLFLCCTGIALLYASVVRFHRLPNDLVREKRERFKAMGFLVAALGVSVCYFLPFYESFREREIFASLYQQYERTPKVSVCTHDIVFTFEGNQFQSKSLLTVENKNLMAVDTVLFYLNPSLQVKEITSEGDRIPFSRKEQVILVPCRLAAGARCTFEFHYEGSVNQTICFPDIDYSSLYQAKRKKRLCRYGEDYFFHCTGEQFAFLHEHFTLLTPEVLWYPTSRPIVNLGSPFTSSSDFTRFTLKVIHPEDKIVVSQGEQMSCEGGTMFTSSQCFIGIDLMIGDLCREVIPIGKQMVEIVYTRGNASLCDKLSITPAALKRGAGMFWGAVVEATNEKMYPFQEMKVVEVPLSFYAFQRPWRNFDNYVHPGIFFFREQGQKVNQSMREQFDANQKQGDTRVDFDRFASEALFTWLTSASERPLRVSFLSPIKLQPPFTVDAPTIPLLNQVLPLLLRDYSDFVEFANFEDKKMEQQDALRYLSRNSLSEAMADPEAMPLMDDIVQLKGEQLCDYLRTLAGPDKYKELVQYLLTTYPQQNISQEAFLQVLDSFIQTDIRDYLKEWYHSRGVASLVIQDECYYIRQQGDTTVRLLHFKVYNKSGVPGMVSLVRSNNFKNEFFKNIVLPPRGAWTVCVPTDTLFKPTKSMLLQYMFSNGFQISTGYSLNLPASVLLHAGTIPAELPSGIAMGIYSCDSSAFLLPTGTILVDNEDAGFFVEEDLPFFQQLKKRENYFPSGKVLSRWTAQVKHDAFGESVKSFHTKTNSRKSSKIEWNAEIAQEGKYELWIYYNNPNPSTKDTKDPYPPQRYALHHDGVVDEIELFPHIFSGKLKLRYANGYQEEQNYKVGNSKWISVGQYDMKVGSVKLILHDDGVEEGKWLYADAVKWVRVD